MSDGNDPAIKLFGRTIPLPETAAAAVEFGGAGEDQDCDEALSCEWQSDSKLQQDEGNHNLTSEEATVPISLADDNPKTSTADNESPASKDPTNEEEESETNNSQEKTLKKPDKILPCPRCNSMDTKFCYYNNYNVNQPRHFCKKCQRYWTAGGTMRNVPVGAGRRKNKNSACHFHQITVSEALQKAQVGLPNVPHYPTVRPNGTVLTFGSDTPLCESVASVFIADKTIQNCARNGFHKPGNLKIPGPFKGKENSDDQSSISSVAAAIVQEENGKNVPNDVIIRNCDSSPPLVPAFAGPPWPYPLNMPQWVSPPGVFPPGYPMPFYPAPPYWGCAVQPPWITPWFTPSLSASLNSPMLGKHHRDENSSRPSHLREEEEENIESSTERSLWIPKTLRIDDPREAAKSSIWATLGIKRENCDSTSRGGAKGGLFKAFQPKSDEKSDSSDTSPVLQANPAALCRSRNFQESS